MYVNIVAVALQVVMMLWLLLLVDGVVVVIVKRSCCFFTLYMEMMQLKKCVHVHVHVNVHVKKINSTIFHKNNWQNI